MLATRPISRETAKARAAAAAVKSCPWCCDDIPREAKKCRSCGEWVVGTSHGIGAMMLRLFGFAWIALSVAIAAGLWFAGQALRGWVWMHSINQQLTPRVVASKAHEATLRTFRPRPAMRDPAAAPGGAAPVARSA